MTNREKLHHFVDELSEDEAEAALAWLRHEREAVRSGRRPGTPTRTTPGRCQRPRGGPRRAVVARGEVRWLELEQEGRRPVVVLTRDEALPMLRNVVVALVTRTVRGIPTEVPLGPSDGMPVECAVSLDNLRTVPQALLTEPITRLDAIKLGPVRHALTAATGC